jgi:hypothetical protein
MTTKHTRGPLDFDPFDGDFGDQGDRTLSDRMVVARREHGCSHCLGRIAVGERHRSRTGIADGSLMAWRWCAACCGAMVAEMASETDDDAPLAFPFEARAAIAKATGEQA